MLFRSILSEGDTIQPRHLNLSFQNAAPEEQAPPDPWADFDLSGSLTEVGRRAAALGERMKIQHALREADDNKGRAAELLQVTYKVLLSKLKEHRID